MTTFYINCSLCNERLRILSKFAIPGNGGLDQVFQVAPHTCAGAQLPANAKAELEKANEEIRTMVSSILIGFNKATGLHISEVDIHLVKMQTAGGTTTAYMLTGVNCRVEI